MECSLEELYCGGRKQEEVRVRLRLRVSCTRVCSTRVSSTAAGKQEEVRVRVRFGVGVGVRVGVMVSSTAAGDCGGRKQDVSYCVLLTTYYSQLTTCYLLLRSTGDASPWTSCRAGRRGPRSTTTTPTSPSR